MARFFKRFGTKPFKYNIEIELDKLTMNINQKCQVAILCKRGPKKYESKQTQFINKIADFHQDKISFQSTLYYQKTKNIYVEKSVSIIFLSFNFEYKAEFHLLFYLPGKTKIGGVYKFNLARYPTSNQQQSVLEKIKFEKCPDKNAQLGFTISVVQDREIQENELIDDTSDIESGSLTPTLKQSKLNNSKNQKFNFKDDDEYKVQNFKEQDRTSPNFSNYSDSKMLKQQTPNKFADQQGQIYYNTLKYEQLCEEIQQLKNQNDQLTQEIQKEIKQHKAYQEAYNQKVAKLEKEIPDLNKQIEDKNSMIANYIKTINENTLKEGQYQLQIQTMNSKINELQQQQKYENKPLNKNESEKLSNENAELKKTIQTLSQRLQEQQPILSSSQVTSLKSVSTTDDTALKKKYEELSKQYQQTNFEFEHLKDQTITDKDQIEELSLANQALEQQLFGTKWKLGKIVNVGFENADAQLLEKIEQILVAQEENTVYTEEFSNELSF